MEELIGNLSSLYRELSEQDEQYYEDIIKRKSKKRDTYTYLDQQREIQQMTDGEQDSGNSSSKPRVVLKQHQKPLNSSG